MGDGWETRRSRGKNFDWLIIKCAAAAKIDKIQIDTHHFKGNYPDQCSIQAAYVNGKASANTIINKSKSWKLILNKSKLHAHKKHNFLNKLMKKNKVVIGGEGNGGIIYPESHYGRDALVGVALFLSLLADKQMSVSALRKTYPNYFMSKKKIELTPGLDVDGILTAIENRYQNEQLTTIDGVKIDFSESWVHLRKSNTEPIIRIYTEAKSQTEADTLADKFIKEIKASKNNVLLTTMSFFAVSFSEN